eukprot:Phypoly_transcript_02516.p1 GENE.Phypoly_transcript_02516~~Phypoly_transcript_02516.p1  ORF type:complete len:784 (+),score=67.50 Phypoly_transcript_02516:366-2717(+)
MANGAVWFLRGSLWLLVLVCFCNPASAQSCSAGCQLNITSCGIVDYPIYWTSMSDVQHNNTVAKNQLQLNALIPNKTCVDYITRFVCNVLYPQCDPIAVGAFPIRPCVQICHDLTAVCGDPEAFKTYAQPEIVPYLNCNDSTLYETSPTASCSHLTNSVDLCSTPTLTWKGACQTFDPALAPITGESCAPFVSKSIYVPVDIPQIQSILDLSANLTATEILKSYAIIPLNCYQYLLSVLCPVIFPACQMVYVPEFNETVAVGDLICKDLCYTAFNECKVFLDTANAPYLYPQCDKADLQDLYVPGPYFDMTLQTLCPKDAPCYNVTVPVKCYDGLFPLDPYAPWTIPKITDCNASTQIGLKTHPGPNDPLCGLKCPDASYTDQEWRKLVNLTQAGAAISLACMAFLIISYLVKYDKRKFPATMHLHEFVATSMFSISFLLGGSHPEKNVWCYDEGTYATQSNVPLCGVQGFFFIFFGIALAAWCAVIAFTMFYAIVLRRTKDAIKHLHKLNVFFILFGWGIPLVFAIAAVASKKIGYGPPLAWCFIKFEGQGYGSVFSSDYPLFYIPVGVLFLGILLLFWITIAAIINVYRQRTASSESRVFIVAQIRVLTFIFVIFAICFTIFEWRFQIEGRNRKFNLAQVGIRWTYCKIKVLLQYADANPLDCPSEHNPARVDYAHTAFESFLLSGIGLLISIAFGSDPGIYKHWGKIFTLISMREWGRLKLLVVTGKDPFVSSPNVSGTDKSDRSVQMYNSSHSNSNSKDNTPTTLTDSPSPRQYVDDSI